MPTGSGIILNESMYQGFNNTPTIQPQVTDESVDREKAKRKKIIKIASVFLFISAVIIVVCILLSIDPTVIYSGDSTDDFAAKPVTSYIPKHVTPGFTAEDLLGNWSCDDDKSFSFTKDTFIALNKLDDDEVGYSGNYTYSSETNLITFDIDSIIQNGEKAPAPKRTWQNSYSVSKEDDKLLIYPDDDDDDDNAYVCERRLDD